MQDNKKYNYKIFLILVFFILTSSLKVYAQNAPFIMSSVGSFPNAANSMSSINFKSIANCIDIQTGIAVLKGERGAGEFTYNCEVSMKFNSLGVKLFPNPVNTFTKIKLQNPPPLTEVFNLSIWSTDGVMLLTKKETGYNLFQGLTIDLNNINAGTYVLKIESSHFIDAIKFIKAN